MSRFLGKIAIEVLAQKVMSIPGWEVDVIDKVEIDLLRNFVRRGQKPTEWPYHERQLYGEHQMHFDGTESYQVIHEFMLLYTDENELYLVICLFGSEFAINIGGPEIDGYERWLVENQNKSPLYMDGKTWRD